MVQVRHVAGGWPAASSSRKLRYASLFQIVSNGCSSTLPKLIVRGSGRWQHGVTNPCHEM